MTEIHEITKKVLFIKYDESCIKNSTSGFQICEDYFNKNPPTKISMITFTSSFNPSAGRGYYLDFHFNILKRNFRKYKNVFNIIKIK